MPEKDKVILPPKYYLDYFNYVIEFIRAGSGHCLGDNDEDFIREFYALSEDARCLLIRMANRKGEYFRLEKLNYDEIKCTPAATEELVEAGFVSLDPPNDPLLFQLYTKAELDKLFPERELKRKYKEDILNELAEEATQEEYTHLKSTHTIIHLLCQDQIEFIKLLFFGHYQGMMTEFVIRDIGNVKLESLEGHEFTPWFDSREEALAVFELSKWNKLLKQAMKILLPEEVLELISPINWSLYLNFPKTRKAGDKLMLRLGEYFEKSGYQEEALSYYSLARKHPARERRIRILEKLNQVSDAKELAEVAYEHPYNASEKIFAKDFLAKQSLRNYRSTTARIKTCPEITVEKAPGIRVEKLALEHFEEAGYVGIHCENYLWRALFGLLFWDELFDANHATFHHPLQRMPSDLHDESFFTSRQSHLLTRLDTFQTGKQLYTHLQQVYEAKTGINNPLVSWHESLLPALLSCTTHLPLKAVKNVALEMARNVKDNSTGFPDLFIWNETEYHFYEIKSPNDHLSAQQLFWLDFFEENEIKAEILRVYYRE